MINKQLKQNGFSLIELMIAMLIGILMLLAATGLFISNKRIYNEQNEMARLQESARFAIDILTKDIRMAGYAGCLDDVSKLQDNNGSSGSGTDTNLHNFTNVIEGMNNKASGTTWLPSASAEQRTFMTNGTDGITLRYIEPIPTQVTFTSGSVLPNKTAAIPVTCTGACSSNITANENMAISDCGTGDIFIATGSAANAILHGATLSKTYDDSAQISRFVTTRYYIGTATNNNQTGDAIPALYRYVYSQDINDIDSDGDTNEFLDQAQELLEGVERMEILYGVDTDADGIPNSYLAAGETGLTTEAHWDTVTSVKISLLLRTIDENVNIDRDINTYTLLNAPAYNPANERLRRRTYTTTVQIRNRTS